MPMPKQEDQTDGHPSATPSGTVDEGQSSSSEDGDSDSVQASPNHTPDCTWQRKRYLQQKGRDWNTFMRYLENRQPKLTLSKVRGTHVLEFLKSIEQVGKTLVHESGCPYFGNPNPPAPCACPLRQSWGSLDAMVGRLRSTCEENPNRPATNPFGVRPVRNYLLQIKDIQATARGIPYSRKRKPKLPSADSVPPQAPVGEVVGDGAESTAAAISFTSLLGEDYSEQAGHSPNCQEKFSAATAYFVDSGATLSTNGFGDPNVDSSAS